FRLRFLGLRIAARRLAAVPCFAVDILQQRHQLVAKDLVILGAAEAMAVAKIDELDAAVGAFLLPKQSIFQTSAAIRGQRLAGAFILAFVEILGIALLAHMVLFKFTFAQNFGDMHRRRAAAAFTLVHG